MKFGLFGNPVSHSLSPKLFQAAYPQSNFSYELVQVSHPDEAVRLFVAEGFAAINVTAPLKTSILPLLHKQTPECAAIGACNLILKQDNALIAHNTDYLGVANSLLECNVPLENATCLLTGAGGAARAAAYALLQHGATLLWANRTPEHIPHSFNGFSITPVPLHQAVHHLPACSVIINTLPQSVPDTDVFAFHPQQTIFDASYANRPLEKQAHHAGARYIGGERWLLHQAIPSFKAMTGITPNLMLYF